MSASVRAASAASSTGAARAGRAILWGGLSAGVLDLTAAVVNNYFRGIAPARVLRAIASGLLGANSSRGGVGTAALGVALHFLIALTAAAVYYALSHRLKFLVRRPYVSGALYGVAVHLFMSLVVLPLSAFPYEVSFRPTTLATNLLIHVLCVGLPISLATRAASKIPREGASGQSAV